MREQQAQVTEFMVKNEFVVGLSLLSVQKDSSVDRMLDHASDALVEIAGFLKDMLKQRDNDDERMARAFLLIEELGETIAAMASGDEVELADGLADLSYVTLGTAATFDIPLARVFDEVHRSNMTKSRRAGDTFIKADKGTSYRPPMIADAITAGRAEAGK